jgi:hypothetical protein
MATNLNQQIQTPALPDVGSAPTGYDRAYVDQSNGAMRVFFIRIVNALSSLFGPRGGKYLNLPYGAFQDDTDQTAANTTTAYAVALSTTDFSNGVTLSNTSRINVDQDGLYNVQFSLQFKNTTNDGQDVDVWFRKNGTNIAASNSRFHLSPRKSSGDPSHIIAAMNFFVELVKNDYVEVMWRPTDVGVSLEHYGTSSSPTRPSIPSAIVTLSFVSNRSA